jgi:hypothetical protein
MACSTSAPCVEHPPVTHRPLQECCDACQREPECAKFVFEKYGGTCELHTGVGESYYTANLISGVVDNRVVAEPPGFYQVEDRSSNIDVYTRPRPPPFRIRPVPPTPPAFAWSEAVPPSPPPHYSAMQEALGGASLVAITVLVLATLTCTYCFFSVEMNRCMFCLSAGRFGSKPKSLHAERVKEGVQARVKPRKLLENKESGWSKVTVQTAQLTQHKEMEVGGCRTYTDLRQLVYDTFGHLLKNVQVENLLLLAWMDSDPAGPDPQWMLVTAASDMVRIRACNAIKALPNDLISESGFAIAAPKTKGRGRRALLGPSDKRKKGGFQAVASDECEGGGDDPVSGIMPAPEDGADDGAGVDAVEAVGDDKALGV